jgi:DNA-binding NarL/FixJ family response regulator
VIRVLLVDDHRMFAEAIGMFLSTEDDIEVLEVLAGAEGVAERVRFLAPDVVLMDIDLPGVDGLIATRQVVQARPETEVVLITALSDPDLSQRGTEAGAFALVAKERAADDLIEVIRRAAGVDEALSGPQLRLLSSASGGEKRRTRALSPRELQVLQGLVDGMSTEELSAALFVSRRTVQGHVQSILTKLQVRSKLEAAVAGLREGLVHLSADERHANR